MGTGGMSTKIKAAKIAVNSGTTMVIASGAQRNILRRLLSGEVLGTIFPAKEVHLKRRKSWLAFGKPISGDIIIDEGCKKAVLAGSSLLAVGVKAVSGNFDIGNTVRIITEDGSEIARGSVNYSSVAIQTIKGHHTSEFKTLLVNANYPLSEEVVHRDNMVIMI